MDNCSAIVVIPSDAREIVDLKLQIRALHTHVIRLENRQRAMKGAVLALIGSTRKAADELEQVVLHIADELG